MKPKQLAIFQQAKKTAWGLTWAALGLLTAIITIPVALFGHAWKKFRNRKHDENPAQDVTLGVYEISGNIRDIETQLLENGSIVRRATDLTLSRHGFYGSKPYQPQKSGLQLILEFSNNRAINIFELWTGLLKSSHFYFISTHSLLPLNLDYPLIRLSGSKLVVQHCGDDVRCRRLHDALFEKYCPGIESGPYYADSAWETITRLFRQRWAETFAIVVTTRNQATFQTRSCHHFSFPQPTISMAPRPPNIAPLILHAPSDRAVKRTDIVLQAISTLKDEGYDFEFQLLENMQNSEVVSTLLKADIVLDQPATWPARFAIEGCASGCCVISGNHYRFIGRPPNPTLQLEADAVLLASTIRNLLKNRDELEQHMRLCWEFWRDYYSPQASSALLRDILQGQGAKFWPLPDQKALLLSRCRPGLERTLVRLLYNPKQSSDSVT